MSKETMTDELALEAWVVFSNWKRVPTCGRERAEEEFAVWLADRDARILEEAADIADNRIHPDDPHCEVCRIVGFIRARAVSRRREASPQEDHTVTPKNGDN